MVTINAAQLSELDNLAPGLQADAKRLAKEVRRHVRWARFEASARDGLRYSRLVSRTKVKHKGDGGAMPAWQMGRIVAENFSARDSVRCSFNLGR
jgi:hypothetical protein